MISEKEIRALLDRIGGSNALGTSPTYGRLLEFLVEGTLSEAVPKEQEIAEHLLGNNFDRSDTSKIRIYVYHLRKKLDQYFENEGKDEAYLLSIPKGGYKVQFKRNKPEGFLAGLTEKSKYLWLPLLGLLLCSVVMNTYFMLRSGESQNKTYLQSAYWKEFFEDDKPIQVVIGDLFIFSELDSLTGEVRNIRIPTINSPAQFEEYRNQEENQGRALSEISYTHLLKASTEWISSLTKVFHPEKEFNIRPYSRMNAKDLLDYNIVFVGMQKTAGIFNSYFDKSDCAYHVSNPERYLLSYEGKEQSFQPKGDPDNEHYDYGFIAKYPGPNENTIFMFAGLWDSAASETLRNFTTESKIAEMERYMKNELGYMPQYFEMLIEVNGIDRIGFETKVIYLREVSGE